MCDYAKPHEIENCENSEIKNNGLFGAKAFFANAASGVIEKYLISNRTFEAQYEALADKGTLGMQLNYGSFVRPTF